MNKILEVSNTLGKYLLRGYILTDEPCPSCSIPMLRPPVHTAQSQALFCSQCTNASQRSLRNLGTEAHNTEMNIHSPQNAESLESGMSSSPQPSDNSEILLRREQSGRASAEIGNRMLKGWAMLAEECPNEFCYGIPLVRPPNSKAEKDKRQECVICGSIYVHERTADGQVVLKKQTEATMIASMSEALRNTCNGPSPVASKEGLQTTREIPLELHHALDSIPDGASAVLQDITINAKSSLISTLDATIDALQHSLTALSARLVSIASISPPEHILIGELAHSIEQVSSALAVVNTLHIQLKN